MGVTASGKSAVGEALAAALGVPYKDADDLHPEGNRAKMTRGEPLDDADRAPWLARVAEWMAAHRRGVVACSALKRAYRDRLRDGDPDARFVLLNPPEAVLRGRLKDRKGHFMPASLLGSQLATLEPPGHDERALVIVADEPMERTVARARDWLESASVTRSSPRA